MSNRRFTDAASLYDFVLAETGSRERALHAAMKAFHLSAGGRTVERASTSIVLEQVCAYYSLPVADLIGPNTSQRCAHPRLVAMYLLREVAMLTHAEAASACNRSEAQARKAVARVLADERLLSEASAIAGHVAEATRPAEKLPVIFRREARA